MIISNFEKDILLLMRLEKEFSLIFQNMKKNRTSIVKDFFNKNYTTKDYYNIIFKEFYDYFYTKDFNKITLIIGYFFYQSFYFSDPDNYFFYNEDILQELFLRTYIAFEKYFERYYSKENVSKLNYVINYDFFFIRNFSRVMVLELNNIKRSMIIEEKRPCSFSSENTISYEETFSNFTYEINEELLFLNSSVLSTYKKK